MLEQKKYYHCQIRLTTIMYNYLQTQRVEKSCSVSAYFRSLLVADMNKKTEIAGAEKTKGGVK